MGACVLKRKECEDRKICLTNTVADNLSHFPPIECDRIKMHRKSSQALGMLTANYATASTRTSLTRGSVAMTEDVTLSEKTAGPDIGGLKGKTIRSRPSPVQRQVIDIPQELLSLREDVEMPLSRCCANGQMLANSISSENCCREVIPNDGTDEKNLIKAADENFQV